MTTTNAATSERRAEMPEREVEPGSTVSAAGLRASTGDRDRAVDRLRRHAGEGRLEVEELEERVEAALSAHTRGELDALLADLPRQRSRPRRAPRASAVTAYLPVMALMVVIWALTGMGYFWPVWPILGMTIGLMSPGACHMAMPRSRRRRLTT